MYNNWFEKNPNPKPGFLNDARWTAHVWGRQTFAKSFAERGWASVAFAQNSTDALVNPWKRTLSRNSTKYLENLRTLQKLHPNSSSISKAIKAAQTSKPRGIGGGLIGVGVTAGLIATSGLLERGPAPEKLRAATKVAGGLIGWELGARAGMGIGAAIGGPLGAAIGYLGGGLIGSIAAEGLTETMTKIPDRLVDRERRRRGLEWGNNIKAFQTEGAHTMRQRSLSAMNRGQMSARSLLGQEAIFVHR